MSNEKLYDLVPIIWRALDKEHTLENVLNLFDIVYDLVGADVESLMWSKNINNVSSRLLPYVVSNNGTRWDTQQSDTGNYNRARATEAISDYSYKGTWARLEDRLQRLGVSDWETIDNNAILMVLGCNGGLGQTDCFLPDADFYHPGARQLIINDSVDLARVQNELNEVAAVGEKWFVKIGE